MNCRSCDAPLSEVLVDLGNQPLANAYLSSPSDPDPIYPLVARLCTNCLLVQADPAVLPTDIFTDYPFASANSAPWIAHCIDYMRTMQTRFHPRQVIEIGSNDGTLLSQFSEDVAVLGIDPAKNIEPSVETIHDFFTEHLASNLPRADLLIANNVLGHVPDINDFTAGLQKALAPDGILTIESPHLIRLIADCQFDTIYHEHFNYWSLHALERLLARHGLSVFDVEVLGVHGGSLRYYIDHGQRPKTSAVSTIRALEAPYTVDSPHFTTFQRRVDQSLHRIRNFFDNAATNKKTIGGIGAPAKANTLLNAAHVRLDYTTDTSSQKQGKYLPGSHAVVLPPQALKIHQSHYALILPWNWADHIIDTHAYIRDWGGQFVIPIPRMEVR